MFQSVYEEKFSFHVTGGVGEWVFLTKLTGDRTYRTKANDARDGRGNDRCQDERDNCGANAYDHRVHIYSKCTRLLAKSLLSINWTGKFTCW